MNKKLIILSRDTLNAKTHSLASRALAVTEGCASGSKVELCKEVEGSLTKLQVCRTRGLYEHESDCHQDALEVLHNHWCGNLELNKSISQVSELERCLSQLETALVTIKREQAETHLKLELEKQLLIESKLTTSAMKAKVISISASDKNATDNLMEETKTIFKHLIEKMEWFVEEHLYSQGLHHVITGLINKHFESDLYMLVESEDHAQLLLSSHIVQRHPITPRLFRIAMFHH